MAGLGPERGQRGNLSEVQYIRGAQIFQNPDNVLILYIYIYIFFLNQSECKKQKSMTNKISAKMKTESSPFSKIPQVPHFPYWVCKGVRVQED